MSYFTNILSFDIEDWFHPEIFLNAISRKKWDQLESRVQHSTEIIMEFLSRKRLKATFFFLGWVAERYPHLVEDADREGHEIASHGYGHSMITKMSPDEYRHDLNRSLEILNSLASSPVAGFRAPTFSVTQKTQWALPIMLELGIRYDSSVFPIYHDRYGIPDAPREPYVIFKNNRGELWEYPMTTVKFGKFNFPCSGGGYFRLYPFNLSLRLMKQCQKQKRAIIFYAHPWEFDTGLPKVKLNLLGSIRHYHGINKFLERLDRITDMFPFTSFKEAALTKKNVVQNI